MLILSENKTSTVEVNSFIIETSDIVLNGSDIGNFEACLKCTPSTLYLVQNDILNSLTSESREVLGNHSVVSRK